LDNGGKKSGNEGSREVKGGLKFGVETAPGGNEQQGGVGEERGLKFGADDFNEGGGGIFKDIRGVEGGLKFGADEFKKGGGGIFIDIRGKIRGCLARLSVSIFAGLGFFFVCSWESPYVASPLQGTSK